MVSTKGQGRSFQHRGTSKGEGGCKRSGGGRNESEGNVCCPTRNEPYGGTRNCAPVPSRRGAGNLIRR